MNVKEDIDGCDFPPRKHGWDFLTGLLTGLTTLPGNMLVTYS